MEISKRLCGEKSIYAYSASPCSEFLLQNGSGKENQNSREKSRRESEFS